MGPAHQRSRLDAHCSLGPVRTLATAVSNCQEPPGQQSVQRSSGCTTGGCTLHHWAVAGPHAALEHVALTIFRLEDLVHVFLLSNDWKR
eukprot:1159404-Pelagomonas_calceolata.AAC.9